MKHLMIDFETLDTTPHAALLSVGLAIWHEEEPGPVKCSEILLSLDDSIKKGRTISANTLCFWVRQDYAARSWADAQDQAMLLADFGSALVDSYPPDGNTLLWGNGADFDLAILKDLYGENYPYNFRNHRCFRTMKAQYPDIPYKPSTIPHSPMHDALAQLEHLRKIYNAGYAIY